MRRPKTPMLFLFSLSGLSSTAQIGLAWQRLLLIRWLSTAVTCIHPASSRHTAVSMCASASLTRTHCRGSGLRHRGGRRRCAGPFSLCFSCFPHYPLEQKTSTLQQDRRAQDLAPGVPPPKHTLGLIPRRVGEPERVRSGLAPQYIFAARSLARPG